MGLRDLLGGSDDTTEDQNQEEPMTGEEQEEIAEETMEMAAQEPEESEQNDEQAFMGVPEDDFSAADEVLADMEAERREGYMAEQSYSDMRALTEKSSGVVPKVFNKVRQREVELGKVEEKLTDPDFWSGNPEARDQLEELISESETLDREEIVDLETREKSYGKEEFEQVVEELFEKGQYEAAVEFGEMADVEYSPHKAEPVTQLAMEEIKDSTKDDGLNSENAKELYALMDSVDPEGELTMQDFEDKVNLYSEDHFDKEKIRNSRTEQEVKSRLENNMKFGFGAKKYLAEATFRHNKSGNGGGRAHDAVEAFVEDDRYAQAAMTVSRFDLGEDQMQEVVEGMDGESAYEALSTPGMDTDSEYGQMLKDEVGGYVDELVEEGEYGEAHEVMDEYDVEDRIAPETELDLMKQE